MVSVASRLLISLLPISDPGTLVSLTKVNAIVLVQCLFVLASLSTHVAAYLPIVRKA